MVQKSEFKQIATAGFLSLLTLIFLAFLGPYAYKYVTEGPQDINYTLADVPGGGIVSSLAFVLVMLAIVIVVVLAIVDML
jgi:TRAP-type C4-dicarboxylate transport system permease small subunit